MFYDNDNGAGAFDVEILVISSAVTPCSLFILVRKSARLCAIPRKVSPFFCVATKLVRMLLVSMFAV